MDTAIFKENVYEVCIESSCALCFPPVLASSSREFMKWSDRNFIDLFQRRLYVVEGPRQGLVHGTKRPPLRLCRRERSLEGGEEE